jgi:hypothetical protein
MAVGAFVDAIVRGFFGYHPPLLWPDEFSQSALDSTLFRNQDSTAGIDSGGAGSGGGGGVSRGFSGKLRNLQTPFGLATITSGADGLSIALQHDDA